jgi:threonine synthase
MRYISTRGEAPPIAFDDALLAGLATDGGLYVPEQWPQLSATKIASFKGKSYADVAFEVLQPFIGGTIADPDLKRMIAEACAAFDSPDVAPLVQLSKNEWVLELFHGPTLAFKDVAMQLIARLMDHVLAARNQRATIVGATSGDTGGAAVEAFRGRDRTDIIILFPDGRVSDVQRRMMTTAIERNVFTVAIDGTFDDCQAIVKSLFNDHKFRDRVKLSGVNSINWARIAAQTVYYFTSAVALGAPERKIAFTVPTGNFGDIFAGYAAKKMGLPISKLIIATNVNDILARTLATGSYEPLGVVATSSPAMDIQVSSNFERLLFEATGRDAAAVRGMMDELARNRKFVLPQAALKTICESFDAGRAGEEQTAKAIRNIHRDFNYLVDPHTAVGCVVAHRRMDSMTDPMVILSTAHPAKFPEAVEAASGRHPALPARHAGLMQKPERITKLPASTEAVAKFVQEKSRAVAGAAA